MQIKTIEKILKKKLDEWVESITDQDVKLAVKRDTTKNPNLTYEYVCTLIDKIFN